MPFGNPFEEAQKRAKEAADRASGGGGQAWAPTNTPGAPPQNATGTSGGGGGQSWAPTRELSPWGQVLGAGREFAASAGGNSGGTAAAEDAWRPEYMPQDPGGGTIGNSFRLGDEQAFFQDQFRQPGAGEAGALGLAANRAQTGAGNTQQQYSQQFNQQIGQDPGLGAYYDRAADRFSTGMNAQLAARGQYGSSRGLGALSEGLSGLQGQRAQQEADYMLQQQQLGGTLANQAGQSQLGWTTNLGKLGLGADQMGLSRASQGVGAAQAADAGFIDQQDALFNRVAGLTNTTMGAFNDIYGNEITTEQQYLDAVQGGTLATGAAKAGQATGDAADSAANKAAKIDAISFGLL